MPDPPDQNGPPEAAPPSGRSAARVALGMLASRGAGFVREASLAYFLGAGPHADVFRTALRGPNLLQNLLGEQTLSASFIPVYSRLIGEGREEEAGRFAGAVFGLLLAVAGGVALLGILLAEPIVTLLAAGYLRDAAAVAEGAAAVDRFPLAVRAVRIIFPMTGVLVLSAWSLGVLNSHRRFFLPYFAPVLWNASMIAALWWVGGALAGAGAGGADRLLFAACFGALAGGLLQFAVQLPLVARVLRGFRLSFSTRVVGVREALRAFTPMAAGRGVVQLSSYLDQLLATFLAAGAVSSLGYALPLYQLPVALFGMSVAAAELPELARGTRAAGGPPPAADAMLERVDRAIRQMAFLTVPTVVGYLAFGWLLVAAIYRRGEFAVPDNWLVYWVLCGYAGGLLASSASRLLQTPFFALGDTRVPARIAVERVALSSLAGLAAMFWLDRYSVAGLLGLEAPGRPLFLGAVGLAAGAAVGAWYELLRLERALASRLRGFRLPTARLARYLAAAVLALAPPALLWRWLAHLPAWVLAPLVVGAYAVAYFGIALRMDLSEAGRWLGRLRR